MNRYVAEGEGFPADNEFLMFINTMIQQVAQLAKLGGTDYILDGCTEAAGIVADGWVVLNGELLPFMGGAVGTDVTVVEAVEQATYLEDANDDGIGDSKDAYITRFARFGNDGEYTVTWASLRRINPLIAVQRAVVPVGGIMMWSGAIGSIPTGWALCDGTNGTPNLSGRFIVGYDAANPSYDTVGNQGGAASVALTTPELPAHNHGGSVTIPPHTHPLPASVPSAGGASSNQLSNSNNIAHTNISQTNSSLPIVANFTTNNAGGGQAHENRPPYYTLAYIMYLG